MHILCARAPQISARMASSGLRYGLTRAINNDCTPLEKKVWRSLKSLYFVALKHFHGPGGPPPGTRRHKKGQGVDFANRASDLANRVSDFANWSTNFANWSTNFANRMSEFAYYLEYASDFLHPGVCTDY